VKILPSIEGGQDFFIREAWGDGTIKPVIDSSAEHSPHAVVAE
jgi:hypothetical protein